MKIQNVFKFFLAGTFMCHCVTLPAQNVGISTSTPSATGYGHGGTNRLLEIYNSNTTSDAQAHVVLSTGSSLPGSIGTITWASPSVTSSDKRLALVGASYEDGSTAGSAGTSLFFFTREKTANQLHEVMRIKGNGFVGIGTSTPNATLQLSNTLELRKLVLREIVNNDYQFSGFGTTYNTLRYQTSSVNEDHVFMAAASSSSSNELMRIKGNGRVGIGTIDPSSALEVQGQLTIDQRYIGGYGGLLIKGQSPTRNYGNIAFSTTSGLIGPDVVGALLSGDIISNTPGAEAIDLTFHTSNNGFASMSEKLRIKGNGNVGIGTNSPQATFHVKSTGSANFFNMQVEQANTDFARLSFKNSNTSNTWLIAASPNATNTNAYFNVFWSGTATNILSLRGDGNAFLAGTLTQSDERLKTGIQKLTDPLGKIDLINGYLYHWKDSNRDQQEQAGVLAQEIEKVMPELVREDSNGIKAVNYNGLIPYLLEAIKTLKAEVEALKRNETGNIHIQDLNKKK